MIELYVKVEPVDLLVSRVKSYVSQEVQELMWDQDSVLHYVQHTDGGGKSEGEYEGGGGITGSLEDMQLYVLEKAPILWELCRGVAVGDLKKNKTSMVILGSILMLVNTQNQKINAYQTVVCAFLYASHIQKAGL